MKERIRELAEQAGMTDDKFGMYFAKDKHNEDGVDLEKFAELIVRECAGIAGTFSVDHKRIHPDFEPLLMPQAEQVVYHSTCQAVAFEIKEHFGLEGE
jgi:hypothetical protein